jgi:site-specific DNA-methyltransferase (adenine-specific)
LPTIIPERAILMSTRKGDVILDPFSGGGGALRMAERHDRYWMGSEIGSTLHACKTILKESGAKQRVNPPLQITKLLR